MDENRKDLVARLLNTGTLNGQTWPELTAEAAAEITALRAALGELVYSIERRWEGESERKRANAVSPRTEEALDAARQALRRSNDDG